MRKTLLFSLFLALLLPASAQAITIPGNPLTIIPSNTGGLQVQKSGKNIFYPAEGTMGEAGLQIAFPFGSDNADQSPPPLVGFAGTAFLSDSESELSGNGSLADPYVHTAYYNVDAPSPYPFGDNWLQLMIEETITYVNGEDQFLVEYQITNESTYDRNLRAMVFGNVVFENGVGKFKAGTPREVSVVSATTGQTVTLKEVSEHPFSKYQVGSWEEVSASIPAANDGSGYDNSLSPTPGPAGLGVQWDTYYSSPLAETETLYLSYIWKFENGAPAPEKGESVTGGVQAGTILIKKPGTDEYVAFDPSEGIPVGSVLDTTKGAIEITSDTGDGTQSATFKGGIFKILQNENAALVNLKVLPSENCNQTTLRKKKKKKKKGSLWGKGKGKYTTSGSKGSGSVRGTTWQVTDYCDGTTMVQSISGRVLAREYKTGRKKLLRSGQKFIAGRKKK